ncbi:hypothetical protein RE6C_03116 [Rhodopirellula europaea 6C]|uniref:Uncharacterized protein n=1 Tax=Rhodopirellula europaea 6C TaxID=1263867 RepID=M2A6A2_9BACT|nr:hypothetical protein RE6C_03116 [Rhodopirellula europaea 6C]
MLSLDDKVQSKSELSRIDAKSSNIAGGASSVSALAICVSVGERRA